MPTRIFRYVFSAFFGLYFVSGFFAGNAVAAVMTHTLRHDVSSGLAVTAAVASLIVWAVAFPLPKVIIRVFDHSAVFRGYSLPFWQIVMVIAGVFGALFGALLPNGPFNAT